MTSPNLDDNILDINLFPANRGAPHALFDLWREQDPVHFNPPSPTYRNNESFSQVTRGFWVLTRYQDVQDVSRDQELFTSHDHGFLLWDVEGEELERQQQNFMGMKPADHAAVKQVIVPPFAPRALGALKPAIDQGARELVDAIAGRGECEFVFDVASKLPVYTFCELMGIPLSYRERVVDYGNAIADVEGRSKLSFNPVEKLYELSMEIAELKRREPDDRLFSQMIHNSSIQLSDLQLANFFQVFAIAGHETTRSTAAHFIYLMHANPEQFELLMSDLDAHLANAIEEVLRFTSTTTNFCRHATRDTVLNGQLIGKGDKVYLSYAAANRDPRVFEDPHRFDITRPNARQHLAFGTGPHVCVGARLARMQLHALLHELLTRLPDLRIEGDPEWLQSVWFNAIVRMQVRFAART